MDLRHLWSSIKYALKALRYPVPRFLTIPVGGIPKIGT